MKKHINVVAAVIVNEKNEILCALRSPQMTLPNLWEFPGGKIEQEESHIEALRREIHEELGITIGVEEKVESTYYEYETFTIQLTSYFSHIKKGIMKATEHAELRWLTSEELLSLEWAPADIPAVKKIMNTKLKKIK